MNVKATVFATARPSYGVRVLLVSVTLKLKLSPAVPVMPSYRDCTPHRAGPGPATPHQGKGGEIVTADASTRSDYARAMVGNIFLKSLELGADWGTCCFV